MKKLPFVLCLFLSVICIHLAAQTFPADTLNRLFIKGRVTKKCDPNAGIFRAAVSLKGTDIFTNTDSLGYYWLDITENAEARSFTLQCSFVNHQAIETTIAYRIIKTTTINFELPQSGGIVPVEMENKAAPKKTGKKAKTKSTRPGSHK